MPATRLAETPCEISTSGKVHQQIFTSLDIKQLTQPVNDAYSVCLARLEEGQSLCSSSLSVPNVKDLFVDVCGRFFDQLGHSSLFGLSVRFGVGRHPHPSKVVASSRIVAMTPGILNVESSGLHSMSEQTATDRHVPQEVECRQW